MDEEVLKFGSEGHESDSFVVDVSDNAKSKYVQEITVLELAQG